MQDLIEAHGGYQNLKSYQMTKIVYDATVAFCNRLIDKRSRTHDKMVQPPGAASRISPKGAWRPARRVRPSSSLLAWPGRVSKGMTSQSSGLFIIDEYEFIL